jgi:hypothetical protein
MRVLENRMLRKIGSKREEVARNWKKIHFDELHNFYPSSDIFRVIKSGRNM